MLAYTGINDLADPSKQDFDDLLAEINDASDILTVKILNQSSLHKFLTIGLSGNPITVDIEIKSWGKVEEPHIAFYGQVEGAHILEWWRVFGTRLFTKNLRSVIGDTDVNNEIKETLSHQPCHFWYFNNGITIVANRITKNMMGGTGNEYGSFHCEGINIVNGAQTVGTIGKFGDKSPEELNDVYVPVRIISLETGESDFGDLVTKANNRQNKIENRDFVTLDPEQTRIKQELGIDGIDYNVMRAETFSPSETSFDLVESTTALACASSKVPLVVQLKREIGKLWDVIGRSQYNQLFNPSVSGPYVWRCVRAQRKIDRELSNIEKIPSLSGRDRGIAIHGNRLIASMVFHEMRSSQFKDPSFNYDATVTDEMISRETQRYFNSLRDFIELYYGNAVIPTLFKNLSKCKDLCQLCLREDPITHRTRIMKLVATCRDEYPLDTMGDDVLFEIFAQRYHASPELWEGHHD